MAKRYDVITPRENGDKTFWHRIGTAWPGEKFAFDITLDSLPIADSKGRVKLMISEAKPKDAPAAAKQELKRYSDDVDDAVPF